MTQSLISYFLEQRTGHKLEFLHKQSHLITVTIFTNCRRFFKNELGNVWPEKKSIVTKSSDSKAEQGVESVNVRNIQTCKNFYGFV